MGLSGPKNKFKISNDPNNNAWSRSTSRFGHKILTSQGWTPGSHLGARDAAHAQHYTAASASHIRVALKDDNLGLGARLGDSRAETFGLNVLQGLLGRLNGKSDGEVKREEAGQRDRNLKLYQGQRWGHMHFIRGGFLVGDSVRRTLESDSEGESDDKAVNQKKRKREFAEEDEQSAGQPARAKTAKAASVSNATPGEPEPGAKRVTRTSSDKITEDRSTSSESSPTSSDEKLRKAEKKRRKADRKARREAKELRRQDKANRRIARSAAAAVNTAPVTTTKSRVVEVAATTVSYNVGRHAVRQRYIRQKQMASMDAQALKEIFMIKSPA